MVKYVLKRLGLALIILLGTSLIIYFLVRLMPFDFVQQKMAGFADKGGVDPAIIMEAMNKRYGLGNEKK